MVCSITRRGGVKAAAEAWTSVHRSRDGIEVAVELIFVCKQFYIRATHQEQGGGQLCLSCYKVKLL